MFNFLNESLYGFILGLNSIFNDFGITIIVFTVILKIILAPVSFLAFLEELKLQKVREEIKKVLKNEKDSDFLKKAEILNEIYKKENYNPFFTLFIQLLTLPILISVFFVLNNLLKNKSLNLFFLNSIDLSQKNIYLFISMVIFQFLLIKELPKEQKKISFILLGLLMVFLSQFPALFNLYWLIYIILGLLEKRIFKFYQVKFGIQPVQKDNP